jgi:penicillin-binding protein 2
MDQLRSSVVLKKYLPSESQTKASEPHAWFTAYAPFDKPEIAISVLLEEAGQGSDIAGPIVRDIFKEYFGREN